MIDHSQGKRQWLESQIAHLVFFFLFLYSNFLGPKAYQCQSIQQRNVLWLLWSEMGTRLECCLNYILSLLFLSTRPDSRTNIRVFKWYPCLNHVYSVCDSRVPHIFLYSRFENWYSYDSFSCHSLYSSPHTFYKFRPQEGCLQVPILPKSSSTV